MKTEKSCGAVVFTKENGNIKYAVTYVPAVEIAGYEEYFESQKKYHS